MIKSAFRKIFGATVLKAILSCIAIISAIGGQCAESRVRVRGLVRDSISHAPVPYAAVSLKGTDHGGLTDENGVFEIFTSEPFSEFVVSAIGYAPHNIPAARSGIFTVIELIPEGKALDEVTVKGRRKRYSKRNNPAVEFMKRLRESSDATNPEKQPYYAFSEYERILLGLNDFSEETNPGAIRKLPFLASHIDTSHITNKSILSLVHREKIADKYFKSNPNVSREIVKAIKHDGVDEVADAESMRRFYEDILREIDIYQNDIPLLQNRFVSPLSQLAPDFYKFYLTDTVSVDTDSCIVLTFLPRNPYSFGFTGNIYVLKDDPDMFVKRIAMKVPPSVNLNYIKNLQINQEYVKGPDGVRLKVLDDLALEGQVIPGTQEVYAERHTVYGNHSFENTNEIDPFESSSPVIVEADAHSRDDKYWIFNRPYLNSAVSDVGSMMKELRKNKVYYWGEKIVKFLISSYLPTAKHSKIDIGPVNTFFSYNELEGARFKLGGMTTANLNRHIFLSGYGAYGIRDHRWKYSGEVEYSFSPKERFASEFPIHSIAASYTYDIDKIGESYLYSSPDNIFLSISHHPDKMIAYHRVAQLRYTLEFENNFSITVRPQYERKEQSRLIKFINGFGHEFNYYDETSLHVQLRYAPGEKYYQGRKHRFPFNFDAPVFTLQHTFAPKGFLGNLFTINITELSIGKRWWFSAWGYLDMIVKGGHAWSRIPYPNLLIPNSNLSYVVRPESFALLNPLEFVNDSYASWDLTYWANGAAFNYIPLFRKLKLREVFSFRGLYGHLSKKNNPALHPELFQFPNNGGTRMMSDVPYMELAVGIDNIFTLLRIDYVWRLTYRDTPHCARSGVQLALHFTF